MMRASESIDKLAGALCLMQGALGPAKKTSENPYFKSHYADLVECIETVKGPMLSNGLSLIQGPSIREDGFVIVTSRLLHSSGQWIETDSAAMPKDAGPQSVGSVITYLRRYSLCAMLGLSAEEDDDGNAAQGEPLKCPVCGKAETVRKSTKPEQPGWYCWKKVGGCGHTWTEQQEIIKQKKIESLDAASKKHADKPIPNGDGQESGKDAVSRRSAYLAQIASLPVDCDPARYGKARTNMVLERGAGALTDEDEEAIEAALLVHQAHNPKCKELTTGDKLPPKGKKQTAIA